MGDNAPGAPAPGPGEAWLAWRRGTDASDPALARRWLERARRLAPDDAMVALSLALACLQGGDPAAARQLFAEICTRHDVAEAWAGLAATALQTGDVPQAVTAMAAALSRHVANPTNRHLAAAIAAAGGLAGWCGVDERHRLQADAPADLAVDGVALRPRWSGGVTALPAGRVLTVSRQGAALLGSPIDLAAIAAVEGFVESHDGGLRGWAWHPGDPARAPVITVAGTSDVVIKCRHLRDKVDDLRPLARPRQFALAAGDLPHGVLRVTGTDGRDLLGSPLDPGLERRCAAGLARGFQPVWADVTGGPPAARPRPGAVDVVVPVFGGRVQTLACLQTVVATAPPGSVVHVVDDCSPDANLVAALQALAASGQVNLIRQPVNMGFPAAVNAGISAAAGRDVVLLNSDTLAPPGWVQALAAAAYAAPDIGTACPLSNEATILSYPVRDGGNPMPDRPGTARLAALAAAANGAATVDLPVAVGFCMFIRRDCLDQTGPFRTDLFAQGYGEENDFCLRARHLGWRHVAATGTFVAHAGGTSFGSARRHLQRRNAAVLGRLHPGYDAMVAGWIERDPLAAARRRMDARRWRAGRKRSAVVLVTHAGAGGVDRVIGLRVDALRAQGVRPIVLRPSQGWAVVGDGATPNLRYRLADDMDGLLRLIEHDRPCLVEFHHTLGHDPAVLTLPARLGVPHDVHIHDYAWFCPRIALVPARAYCGEPPVPDCEACIADHGSNLDEAISVPALVDRSARLLSAARRVVAPARDVATRMQRHFPGQRAEVEPWEDDAAVTAPEMPKAIRRVCLVGGIGIEKGYDLVLACLRDTVRRTLPLTFTLVGHSADDERLLAAGPIEITGRYAPSEVDALIRAQRADVAFVPSIWPETWCFTLGHAWRAGLRAVVFDLGAPAERVRRTGWGWVLPLGLPPHAVNDWLLRYKPGLPAQASASNFGRSRHATPLHA